MDPASLGAAEQVRTVWPRAPDYQRRLPEAGRPCCTSKVRSHQLGPKSSPPAANDSESAMIDSFLILKICQEIERPLIALTRVCGLLRDGCRRASPPHRRDGPRPRRPCRVRRRPAAARRGSSGARHQRRRPCLMACNRSKRPGPFGMAPTPGVICATGRWAPVGGRCGDVVGLAAAPPHRRHAAVEESERRPVTRARPRFDRQREDAGHTWESVAAAVSPFPVLIEGERFGKELVARAIHARRAHAALLSVELCRSG